MSQRLRELSFLNRGILITLDDERDDNKKHRFQYQGGIASFVEHLNRNKEMLGPVIMIEGQREGVTAEIALQWNDGYAENIYSFANNINTHDGGTHLVGFKSALTRTVNAFGTSSGLPKDLQEGLQGEDTREGLTAVISAKVPNPQFEGQTKGKLGNSEVKGIVESLLNDKLGEYFERNPPVARRIIFKILEAALGRAKPRARPAISPGGRAPWTGPACPASSRNARSATRRSPSCSWWRATPRAAPPSRAATGSSRPSCPCAARSSTWRRRAWTRRWPRRRSATSSPPSARGWARTTSTSPSSATTASSSCATPTSTAPTSARCS